MSRRIMEKNRKHSVIDFVINNKAILILLVIVIIASLASPVFLTSKNLLNVLRQICVSSVLGIGLTFVIGSGNMDLSVGDMISLLGCTMAILSRSGVPFPVCILAGVLVGICCGAMNGIIAMYIGIPTFIVTLADGQIFNGITCLITHNSAVINIDKAFKTLGQGTVARIPIPVYVLLAVVVVFWFLMNKTTLGRQIIATGGNREAARVSGIDTKRIIISAYILVGICASISALLLTGRTNSAQVTAGAGMSTDSIAAVVIGGTPLGGGYGKVEGTVIGCLIIGVINNLLNLLGVDSNWQLVAKGAMILIAVTIDILSTKYIARRMERV